MDITDPSYIPDSIDLDACTVFELQQKHAFSLLVSNVKESSTLPVIRKYSDPNATYYSDAQQLYQDLVAHCTQGLSGQQRLELLEKNLDELCLDKKWDKTTEAFLRMVDNRLKDHIGSAPDPAQYPELWYVTRLNQHTQHSINILSTTRCRQSQ